MTPHRLYCQPIGAQLLRAKCGLHEWLYLSAWHDTGATRPARGGVPVLFPQFADQGPLKKHGWARDLPWTLHEETVSAEAHTVGWQLHVEEGMQPDWPHGAQLTLRAQASDDRLSMELSVKNTGTTEWAWTGGLHPYWATTDLNQSALRGLNGMPVQDRYRPERAVELDAAVCWTGQAFECLYDTTHPLTWVTPTHTLQLSMTGFDQWMVWNPGSELASRLDDLPAGDWQRFVCIEPVRVDRPCRLQPGEVFNGSLTARWWDTVTEDQQ